MDNQAVEELTHASGIAGSPSDTVGQDWIPERMNVPRSEDPPPSAPNDMSRPELYREDKWQEPFRAMRLDAPVNRCENSIFGPYWNISSHAAIQHVESLPELYSSSWEYSGITIADRNDDDRIQLPMFIAMDRPQHTGQRRTVAPAFTPAEMTRMSGDIRQRTAEILDRLPVGESFDWVDKVSIELTTQMLAILFDFPWENRRKLTYWSDWAGDIEIATSAALKEQRLAVLYDMAANFKQLWDSKLNAEPTPDLISMMIHSEAMSHMSDEEFMGNLVLLIVGGNDTTRNSMSAYAYGMDKFPDERAKLEANPALIPNATSEIIRWQTPLAHMRRTATADAELFGHEVKAMDKLILWYISANRDEAVFERPDDIIVDRENARRHLAFGHGIHRCVGARLAELQISILMEEMAKRRLRVHVTGEVERTNACFVHGYRKMGVELERY
ncbi:cytochrome P450 [Pseudonocardia sp. TMWB2A]|uniref:cytochrome P450 n=1 Tax=Pseudonocardia sp. TMWB2A TaxID=687430 RepID=UPI00307DF7C7